MAFELKPDVELHLVHVYFSGKVDAADMAEAVKEMERRGLRQLHQLWDLTEIDSMVIEPNDFQYLVDLSVERAERYRDAGKIAAAAADDTYYTVVRLIQHRAARKGIRAETFRSLDEARTWILHD